MDAGCEEHGCWYARDGYNRCYDTPAGDGRCILAASVMYGRRRSPAAAPAACFICQVAGIDGTVPAHACLFSLTCAARLLPL